MARKNVPLGSSPEVVDFVRRLGLDPSLTRRVIIDIPAYGLVKVYVEQNGAMEAFEVRPPFAIGDEGVIVETAGILECHHEQKCTSVDACWTKDRR